MSAYTAQPLVEGFPGTSSSHGAFGWSSLWLLQSADRRVLIDAGQPAYIPLIHSGLAKHGLTPTDITDVLITHLHWDHVANFTMFPHATTWVNELELDWASQQPAGTSFIPDLHVQELQRRTEGVERFATGQEILPQIHAVDSSGHTPHHSAFLLEESTGQSMIFAGDAVKNINELETRRADSSLDHEASTRTIERLRSLMTDTSATLIPGHDVALDLIDAKASRQRLQRAQISFFADGTHSAQDRSIA